MDDVDDKDKDGIIQGLRDIIEGRTRPLEEVRRELQAGRVWDYSFRLWPSFKGFNEKLLPKTRQTLDMSLNMVETYMTEAEFQAMVGQLYDLGFELHEASRREHHEWDTVLIGTVEEVTGSDKIQ